jgi:hypothetical protein
MGFVHRVHKRNADVTEFHLELRQDGVAKGFSGDAGAIRHKENGGIGHEKLSMWVKPKRQVLAGEAPYRPPTMLHYPNFATQTVRPIQKTKKSPRCMTAPVLTFGACL